MGQPWSLPQLARGRFSEDRWGSAWVGGLRALPAALPGLPWGQAKLSGAGSKPSLPRLACLAEESSQEKRELL